MGPMSAHHATSEVRFCLLGPLEVTVDGAVTDVGGPRQQVVLALLALTANQTVPVERLVTAVYGEDPPATARVQVQICVSTLRRLFDLRGYPGMIATRPAGYS